MRKLLSIRFIVCVLGVALLGLSHMACTTVEPTVVVEKPVDQPPQPQPKPKPKPRPSSGSSSSSSSSGPGPSSAPEAFQAIEKPSTYTP